MICLIIGITALFLCIVFTINFKDESAADCSVVTNTFALFTSYTLGRVDITSNSHVHFTCFFAFHTISTFTFANMHPVESDSIK